MHSFIRHMRQSFNMSSSILFPLYYVCFDVTRRMCSIKPNVFVILNAFMLTPAVRTSLSARAYRELSTTRNYSIWPKCAWIACLDNNFQWISYDVDSLRNQKLDVDGNELVRCKPLHAVANQSNLNFMPSSDRWWIDLKTNRETVSDHVKMLSNGITRDSLCKMKQYQDISSRNL